MADTKVGDLPRVVRITDSDLLVIEQNGQAYSLPGSLLKQYAEAAAGAVKKGDKGDKGTSVTRVELVAGNHASGTLDTYRMYFDDIAPYDFNVYNGYDGQGAVDTVNGKVGNVTVEECVYTATIGTTWSGTDAPFTQTISIPGITAQDNPTVDVIPSADYESALDELGDWGNVYRITTSNGYITVYSHDQTVTPINIKVKVLR